MDQNRRPRHRRGRVRPKRPLEAAGALRLPPRGERSPRPTVSRRSSRRSRPRWPRKNTRQRRARYLPWLLLVLGAELLYVGLHDPRFNLARIEVQGNQILTAEQVVRRSGLKEGINLFRTPVRAAQARLLKVPAVAAVTLHRRPPDRILIRVHEREPMACVATGGGFLTIDAAGVAFRGDPKPPRGLPLVTGLQQQGLRFGKVLDRKLATALRDCLAAAKEAAPQHQIARISIDQNGNLCFNSDDVGYEVRLGPPEQLSEKLTLLTALERSLPDIGRDCEYIDLSCPEAPAWKPKQVNLAAGAASAGAFGPTGVAEGTPHGRGRFTQD